MLMTLPPQQRVIPLIIGACVSQLTKIPLKRVVVAIMRDTIHIGRDGRHLHDGLQVLAGELELLRAHLVDPLLACNGLRTPVRLIGPVIGSYHPCRSLVGGYGYCGNVADPSRVAIAVVAAVVFRQGQPVVGRAR